MGSRTLFEQLLPKYRLDYPELTDSELGRQIAADMQARKLPELAESHMREALSGFGFTTPTIEVFDADGKRIDA